MMKLNNNKANEAQNTSPSSNIAEGVEGSQSITIKQLVTPPLFRHYEKNLVLFAYNKEIDEDPPNEILVMQQSKKRYNQVTEQDKIAEMFGNINISGTAQKLFLTKINPLEHRQINKEIQQMLDVADNFTRKDRLERRKEMFESSRPNKIVHQFASEEVMAKRKIRVVKMDSLIQGGSIKGVVQLGGKSVEYEDLNLMSENQNYYALIRRTVRVDEVFPQVNIEQNFLNSINFENPTVDEEKNENEDDYDSNDSQNSAFDYPEEQGSSRSSEQIIRDLDDMDEENVEYEDDEQELYRKYLRRQRRKQREMDEQHEYAYEEYD